MGTCHCMRMTITFGRASDDDRSDQRSVERNIEQLNAHLLAEEIEKIRKMLPIEYRRKTSLFETQLQTLKNVEQFLTSITKERLYYSGVQSSQQSRQTSPTAFRRFSSRHSSPRARRKLYNMNFPKPELYTVECKNFTAISTAPFYIGPTTPRQDKRLYFACNKPGERNLYKHGAVGKIQKIIRKILVVFSSYSGCPLIPPLVL